MKKLLIGAVALIAMIIVGCGGGATQFDAPQIIQVVMTDTDVEVTWEEDTAIEGDEDFEGYNVYVVVADDSSDLLVDDGENLNKDNATPITGQVYTVAGLSQDTVYAIQVRTVNIDDVVGGYNMDVPFVLVSPRPEFERTVYIEWNNSDTMDVALHFETGDVGKRSEISVTWGDMWLDHEVIDDTVWFQSAYKADTTAGYRDTRFENAGQYAFDEMWEATDPTLQTVAIVQGDLVFAKTVEGNYVKIHVDSLYLGGLSNSWAQLTYGYQNIIEFPNLSP